MVYGNRRKVDNVAYRTVMEPVSQPGRSFDRESPRRSAASGPWLGWPVRFSLGRVTTSPKNSEGEKSTADLGVRFQRDLPCFASVSH